MAQHNAGHHEASLRNVETAMAWNPIRPAYYPAVHAFAAYGAQRYAEALHSASECSDRAPAILRCKGILLSSLMRLGREGEAQTAWARLLTATPALQNWRGNLVDLDADLDRLRAVAAAGAARVAAPASR